MDKLRTRITVSWDEGVSALSQWQTNVTTNGGTYSATDTNALSTFYNSISSFTTKIKRLNLFIGRDEAAALTPQIYDATNGGIADVREGYGSSQFVVDGGMQTTGSPIDSSKRINTNYYVYNDSSILTTNNQLTYWQNGDTNEDGYSMYTPSIYSALLAKYGGNQYGRNFHDTTYSATTLGTASGLQAWRRQATTMQLFKNGVSVYTDNAAGTATAKVNTPLYVCYGGATKSFGYAISEDLTDAENLTLYNAWATLNTALGR